MADMSERWRKFESLGVRFIVWLTPSWLWQKFQLLLLRLIVWRNPSLVDRKIKEVAREGAIWPPRIGSGASRVAEDDYRQNATSPI